MGFDPVPRDIIGLIMDKINEFEEFQRKVRDANSLMPRDALETLAADAELVWQFVHPSAGVSIFERDITIRSFISNRCEELGDRLLKALWTTAGGNEDELRMFLNGEI